MLLCAQLSSCRCTVTSHLAWTGKLSQRKINNGCIQVKFPVAIAQYFLAFQSTRFNFQCIWLTRFCISSFPFLKLDFPSWKPAGLPPEGSRRSRAAASLECQPSQSWHSRRNRWGIWWRCDESPAPWNPGTHTQTTQYEEEVQQQIGDFSSSPSVVWLITCVKVVGRHIYMKSWVICCLSLNVFDQQIGASGKSHKTV